MYDLNRFGVTDLIRLSTRLRQVKATSLEEAAEDIVRHLYGHLIDKATGGRSSVLVRFYKTERVGDLPPDLRRTTLERLAARGSAGRDRAAADAADDDVRCLTLLATAGEEAAGNHREQSRDHAAIPLPTAEAVERSPMIQHLLQQLGVDVGQVVRPDDRLWVDPHPLNYNVLHVADAAGSPYVPAKDFVARWGVRSVLGFGGLLPGGDVFAVIVFSRTPISRATAQHFRTAALSVAVAVGPLAGRVYAGSEGRLLDEVELTRWQAAALSQLLSVREEAILHQTIELEQALVELEDRAAELGRSQVTLQASEARKGAILEAALDAIVTMDAEGLITEFNAAAERLFGYARNEAVGAPMAELLVPHALRPLHHAGIARYLETGEARILDARVEVSALTRDGSELPVELTVTRVGVPGPALFTAYIRDLSSAKQVERQLRELADTLQASLLPPHVPRIPGLEVATYYHPADRGLVVGGDFFDVFRVADGAWGIVMGDVCGKGARAAALTALARYTVRAAAIHHPGPAAALEEVNAALLDDDDEDDRFCTVVFTRMEVRHGAASAVVTTAGHPPALVIRSSGIVETVGEAALPLGMFETFAGTDVDVELGRGDALVVYTDGLIEARDDGGDEFGIERLVATAARFAGQPAPGIVGGLVEAVLAHARETTDDAALVVLRVPAVDTPG